MDEDNVSGAATRRRRLVYAAVAAAAVIAASAAFALTRDGDSADPADASARGAGPAAVTPGADGTDTSGASGTSGTGAGTATTGPGGASGTAAGGTTPGSDPEPGSGATASSPATARRPPTTTAGIDPSIEEAYEEAYLGECEKIWSIAGPDGLLIDMDDPDEQAFVLEDCTSLFDDSDVWYYDTAAEAREAGQEAAWSNVDELMVGRRLRNSAGDKIWTSPYSAQ